MPADDQASELDCPIDVLACQFAALSEELKQLKLASHQAILLLISAFVLGANLETGLQQGPHL